MAGTTPTRRIGTIPGQFAVRGDDPSASRPPVFLDDDDYAKATSAMPRPCIDLVIVDRHGRMLLGLRASLPVRDWGVVGGKMPRGTTFETALQNIADAELGGLVINPSRLVEAGFSNYLFGEVDRQDITLHFAYVVTDDEAAGIKLKPNHFTDQRWVPLGEVADEGSPYDPIFKKIAENVMKALGLK
jgi:ADP-ribose pyrophosphatase YjhB (NUDIX family)